MKKNSAWKMLWDDDDRCCCIPLAWLYFSPWRSTDLYKEFNVYSPNKRFVLDVVEDEDQQPKSIPIREPSSS